MQKIKNHCKTKCVITKSGCTNRCTSIPLSGWNPFVWNQKCENRQSVSLEALRLQKQGILDVALILNDNTRIDVELQMRFQDYWKKRNLFYLAKLYTDDLKAGDNYKRLRKCIMISILDFRLIENEKYHNVYTLRNKNGEQFTDD